MAQHDPLTSHPHGIAPPTRRAHQQSAWHSATHATRTPAIRMAQRHPRHTHTSNAHGTAPPTRHAHQPSAWHSATHATRSPAIRTAQRHPRDPLTSHPHGTAPPTRRAHQQSAWNRATQRPVKPAHQAVKSSTQRESSPKRPAPARTTHPPTIDLRPLKVIPRFDFFAPAALTVTQLLQFSNPCNTHPSNTHP